MSLDLNVRPHHNMRPSRLWVLFVSFILAYVVAEGIFPTPNIVGGGEAKMVLLIVLTVVFKAAIDYFLSRRQKKKDRRRDDKPVA